MKHVKSKMKNWTLLLAVFGAAMLAAPLAAQAAWLLSAEGNDEEVAITLSLTPADSVNAFAGEIGYSSSLKFVRIEEHSSITTFWTEPPEDANGTITFEGVIAGGFQGIFLPGTDQKGPGPVLTAVFTRVSEEPATLIARGTVYLNDGVGTPKELSLAELSIASGSAISSPATTSKDQAPPEPFMPEEGRDPDLFGNDWFIAWNAYDKGSGIDHYEILESRSGLTSSNAWQRAVSPYRLTDQTRKSFIHIKAFDRAGNVRTVVLPPAVPAKWYGYLALQLTILALVVATVASALRRRPR